MVKITGFNANEYEDKKPTLIAEGLHKAHIVESNDEERRDGNGRQLVLNWQVLEGDSKGLRIYQRLQLGSTDPAKVEKAKNQLAGICRSVGIETLNDTQELHGKPAAIMVSHSEWQGKTYANVYYTETASSVSTPAPKQPKPNTDEVPF